MARPKGVRSDSDPLPEGALTTGNPITDVINSPDFEDQQFRDYADLRERAEKEGGSRVMDIADQNQRNTDITTRVKAKKHDPIKAGYRRL